MTYFGWCEVCEQRGDSVLASHQWGMDLTLLCNEHYAEAERNYESWATS